MRSVERLTLIALVVFACGCGGGESTGSVEATTGNDARSTELSPHERNFQGPDGRAQSAFGHEASRAERAQASRVIEGWMRARAATDWAADCSYFSRRYRHALVAEDATEVSDGEVQNCPQALAFFGIAASGDYENTLSGPIDRFGVAGGLGIALYHGNDGNNWAVTMEKEAGRWWVAVAMPNELQ